MYDFFKLDISYLEFQTLLNNDLLEWLVMIDQNTGEIKPMFIDRYKNRKLRPEKVAYHKGLYFERYNKRNRHTNEIISSETYISGSLHSFSNDGKHNADDYTLERHTKAIETLIKDFNIIPSKTRIHHIEVSTLLRHLKYPTDKINSNIMVHISKGAEPKRYNNIEFEKKSNYKKCRRTQYIIKSYLKHLQFNLNDERFRFEVKYFKMERLNSFGFYYLSQTIESKYIEILQDDLLQRWNETLLFDWTIDKSQLSKKQKLKLNQYNNPNYWIGLSPQKRYYNLNTYKELVNKYSECVHQYIANEIKGNSHNLTTSTKTIDSHNLTNNIVSTCKKSNDRIYPDYIYDLDPDNPDRKKLRNDKSNRVRAIEKKVNILVKLDRMDCIDRIGITTDDKEYLLTLSHKPRWQRLNRLLQHSAN
jgi:hypothetical protein